MMQEWLSFPPSPPGLRASPLHVAFPHGYLGFLTAWQLDSKKESSKKEMEAAILLNG